MLKLYVDCELGTGQLHETPLSGGHTEFICDVPEVYAPQNQKEFEHLLKEQGIENGAEFKFIVNARIADLIRKAIMAEVNKDVATAQLSAPVEQQVTQETPPNTTQPKKSRKKTAEELPSQRIVRLSVSNVKRITAAEITPEGDVVTIGGQNGQGKTSVLDAIEMAFAGKDAFTERPIRDGEKSAKIVAELDDIVVTRTITPSGGVLTVTSKDGEKYNSPQELLNALTGKLSFDPMAFAAQGRTAEGRKAQLATLQKLVGLDFTDEDEQRKGLYEERTMRGRELQTAKALLAGAKHNPDVGNEEQSASALGAKLAEAQKANLAVTTALEKARQARETYQAWGARVAKLREELAEAEVKLAEAREFAQLVQETAARLKVIDTQAIVDQMTSIDATNRKIRENRAHADAEKKVQACNEAYDELTQAIEHLAAEKAKKLSEARFPVPGLSFDETGVLVNGLPFSEASMAEQIRVSVAMGIALNPTLKVILIRDGSLLDKNSLALVAQMAKNAGVQIWMEKVSDDGVGCSVVIENGAVKT